MIAPRFCREGIGVSPSWLRTHPWGAKLACPKETMWSTPCAYFTNRETEAQRGRGHLGWEVPRAFVRTLRILILRPPCRCSSPPCPTGVDALRMLPQQDLCVAAPPTLQVFSSHP